MIQALFRRSRERRTAVRLLGIRLSKLEPGDEQLCLFDRGEPLHRTMDDIRERFGFAALRNGLAGTRDDPHEE